MSGPSGPILGIDGSLGPFSAALIDPLGEPIGTAVVLANKALELGLGAIVRVLDGIPLASLRAIAVGLGPGSYTGTRIAVSYAKALGLASGVGVIGISSYDAVQPDDATGTIVTVVPARRDLACVRITRAGGHEVRCGGHDELSEWIRASGETRLWSAGVSEGDVLRLAERGCDVRISVLTEPAALRIARLALSRTPQWPLHAIVADYGFPAAPPR